jgi:hypothetical protein
VWEFGNDACSFYPGNSTRDEDEGEMHDVSEALGDLQIDLLFVNCEGGEFDILDRLHETGQIKNVRLLMVQFHTAITKGNGRNYKRCLDQLKEDFVIVWTIGAPWTLLERMSSVQESLEEIPAEKPACSKCGFRPGPGKNYEISMRMHRRSH